MNQDDLRRALDKKSTDELLAVLHPQSDYLPAAVLTARALLIERGVDLDADDVQRELAQVGADLDLAAREADEPLSVGLKIVCVVFAGFPAMVIAAYNFSKGRRRRGREALDWMVIGILAGFVLGVLGSLGAAA